MFTTTSESTEVFNRSLEASLKSAGRLAIIDFAPEPGSALPPGLPTNRGGHGILPELVVQEVTRAGFSHVITLRVWPPGQSTGGLFLVLFARSSPSRCPSSAISIHVHISTDPLP